jgi:hypothetical protein
MPLFIKGMRGKRTAYRVEAARDGVQLTIDDTFWNDTVVSPRDGTTQLDVNIAQVVQEIRAALYYIATDGTKH